MSRFVPGNHVRVIDPRSTLFDKVFTISVVIRGHRAWVYETTGPNIYTIQEHQLTHAEQDNA